MYVLESGTGADQRRYRKLLHRLDSAPIDPKRYRALPAPQIARSDRTPQAETAILAMFDGNPPLTSLAIHEQLRHCGFSRPVRLRAMQNLTRTGILIYVAKKIRLIADDFAAPMDVGMPIVFLPGMRSQEPGVIIDQKELKHGGGGVFPIAKLRSGRTVFVNPDMAKADISELNYQQHERWLIELLQDAGETGMGRNDIARIAYRKGIPKLSGLIIRLEKEKVIRGRLQVRKGEKIKVFWLNEYFPELKRK